jgi:phosphoglycolate phosphatase
VTVDAAVFDIDGVLVDSLRPVTASINAALRDHGLAERPPAELRRFIGPPTFSAFAELLGRPPQAPEVAAAVATYRDRYAACYLTQTTVFDGVAAMLAELSGRAVLAVATSKSADFAQPLLEALGLARFFVVVAAAAPSSADDDKTAIVGRALEALRARSGAAREVAMVGDRRFDMEAALVHGLAPIGVSWGIGSVAELREAGAVAIADTPAELLALLADGERYT